MNKNKKVILLISVILLFIAFVYFVPVPCLFKKMFSIPCPACGLTRALKLVLQLKIIESFKYNILAFPLFLISIISFGFLVHDLLLKKKDLLKIYSNIFNNYYVIIITILLVNWIINIIRDV